MDLFDIADDDSKLKRNISLKKTTNEIENKHNIKGGWEGGNIRHGFAIVRVKSNCRA